MTSKLIGSKRAELQEQIYQPVSTILAIVAIVIILGLIIFVLSKFVL